MIDFISVRDCKRSCIGCDEYCAEASWDSFCYCEYVIDYVSVVGACQGDVVGDS